ncbi:MAG: hypothetical protein M3N48_09895 [Verrucomicrobiota bacterium]|nr:hypothetical protein [Verrucomicrobiota bacterium]
MNTLWTLLTGVVRNILSLVQAFASRLPAPPPYPPQTHRKEFSTEVVRPDDLLVVTFDFYNLQITPTVGPNPARLERRESGNGFIVAHFPPQSVGEQAFFEATPGKSGDSSEPLAPPPVAARIAGPSQLIFRISDALLPLDFSLEKLLDALRQSETVVQPTIQRPLSIPPVGGRARFGGTRAQFSAVEAPYRLILSPNLESRWQHALGPVKDSAGKHTELWHTRISANATVDAVWSPDYVGTNPPPPDNFPFRMSLNRRYRHEIVRSSADRSLLGARPIDVQQLMLSSQGAWLSVRGQWQTELDLSEWRHIMTAGRDQYARIVEEGYLFPLRHRAVIVTITERKIATAEFFRLQRGGEPAAYLRQRKLIFLREPTKSYQHRHIPFRTATIKTLVTPNLEDPISSEILPGEADNAFWPKVAGENFHFHVIATDWEGREIEFHAPLAFVIRSLADSNPAKMTQIVNLYNGLAEADERRSRDMGGQKIAFAPRKLPNDTTLETSNLIFGAMNTQASPRFLPMMYKAKVGVPAVQRISGQNEISTIALDQKFTAGTGNAIGNMTEVFAYLTDKQTPVAFPKEKVGGMVAPDFGISSLSRAFGPVGGDPKAFADGTFDPFAIFKGVKLLGGIDLGAILKPLKNATQDAASGAIPGLKNVRMTKPDLGDVFETTYHWDIDEKFLESTGIFKKKPGSTFSIHSVLDTPLNGSPARFTVDGALTNFAVTLLPTEDPKSPLELVGLNFDKVEFHAGSNKKLDFGIVFAGFEFLGPLRFVNKLMEIIPLDAFNDPPFLDIILPPNDHPGVTAGFTLGIPTVGIGVFVLQNISFGASFFLPFIGEPPNLRLAFCERHQPFSLTVSLLGGGGFFAIDIGMAGVKIIEAALEFGAAIAINLGVAAGALSIMGGVYYQKSGAGFELSAYVRANGSLSVLGIITVSVEFYIALSYSSKGLEHGGKLWGEATLSVKIKIAFFSKSVSIHLEREFAGSDPKFIEMVSPLDWKEYCNAFADYPA